MTPQDIRWKQRFSNFKRAFLLLREAIESDPHHLSQLEKEGIIQRFAYTFELAWKVLKDKMESDGIELSQISPKTVIREAFTAKYISDTTGWFSMMVDRNLMSHTYDFSKFEAIIQSIRDSYLPILQDWYNSLLKEIE